MPTSAAALKLQIEAQLARRIPAALSPAPRSQAARLSLADARLNELLGGGVPLGAISEVYGEVGSGRTSFAMSLASAVTVAGGVAAWVDVSDALDPEAAALCGVDLERLLWVRCGVNERPAKAARTKPYASAVHDEVDTQVFSNSPNLVATNHTPKPVGNGGCGSPHPRGEGKGMAEAIDSLLRDQPRSAAMKQKREQKSIGTPGAHNRDLSSFIGAMSHRTGKAPDRAAVSTGKPVSNGIVPPGDILPTGGALFGRQLERKLSSGSERLHWNPVQQLAMPFPNASPYREEQVPTDRQPSRRLTQTTGAALKAEHCPALRNGRQPEVKGRDTATGQDRWAPLDQALRTIDLLLQAGGFSLLVLDLGSVPANMAWRIPLATWFRFRAGCERSRVSLLVLSQHPCARASADLTIAMQHRGVEAAGDTVVVCSSFHLQLEQRRRTAGADVEPAGNVVPLRKPPRADNHSHLAGTGTWTVSAPWSVRV